MTPQDIELEILTSDPIELEVASDEENLPLETQEFVRGGGSGGTVDPAFDINSENPVQNKVITAAFNQAATALENINMNKADKSELPEASDDAPSTLGATADSGLSNNYSRADHVHPLPTAEDVGALPDSTEPSDIGALPATGDAYRASSIPMGQLDGTSTATVMTATVPGITELRDGVCVWLRNGVIASASGVTLNINSLGAKPIYNSLSGAVVTTTFTAASTYLFVYNATRVTGGCWDMVYGYDANTTYTPVKLGFGYATCSTAEATTAKTAALSSYTLTTGGIVAVKFTNAVPADSTLNVNSKGAKAIYYKGAPITAGVIKAGDTVTMIYSTYYHVLSIDRDEAPVASVNGQTGTVVLGASDVGAVASNQGVAHAGKFIMVGSDGVVAPVAMAAWQGGNY